MKVHILRACSGAGKSTKAAALVLTAMVAGLVSAVFSADTYMVDAEGNYCFDFTKLSECHNQCLRGFTEALQGAHYDVLIVDNTNTTLSEIAPYAALALAYGAELKITTLRCDPRIAHSRNVHEVPLAGVEAQAARLVDSISEMPPWWPHEVENV